MREVLIASDIDVRVENCEVTLSGVVEDRRAKRLAEGIARACPAWPTCTIR
jgi:osmotically-inducible protein OsmY